MKKYCVGFVGLLFSSFLFSVDLEPIKQAIKESDVACVESRLKNVTLSDEEFSQLINLANQVVECRKDMSFNDTLTLKECLAGVFGTLSCGASLIYAGCIIKALISKDGKGLISAGYTTGYGIGGAALLKYLVDFRARHVQALKQRIDEARYIVAIIESKNSVPLKDRVQIHYPDISTALQGQCQ
jgi:hypothetical protein